jgi:hypothetical protein
MGNSTSVMGDVIKYSVLTGLAITGFISLYSPVEVPKRSIQLPMSPSHMNESFLSMESIEGSELEGEIERTATFIASVKWLMENEAVASRKRQLEESLVRAESSFNNLFELKTKLEEYENTGVMLGSQVTSEIAKSSALRDIEERLLFSEFGTKAAPAFISIDKKAGDMSPYKRQRTQTS